MYLKPAQALNFKHRELKECCRGRIKVNWNWPFVWDAFFRLRKKAVLGVAVDEFESKIQGFQLTTQPETECKCTFLLQFSNKIATVWPWLYLCLPRKWTKNSQQDVLGIQVATVQMAVYICLEGQQWERNKAGKNMCAQRKTAAQVQHIIYGISFWVSPRRGDQLNLEGCW